MKRTENISSAQLLKKTPPEEFDLVILGGGTGSTIAAVQVAMIAGLPYTAVRDAVLTHPTLAEGRFRSSRRSTTPQGRR
jgi:pyruvate/2-oxoglutarate dehydrogenase complex dihydrolipoamide dehydrogenase (E3) component